MGQRTCVRRVFVDLICGSDTWNMESIIYYPEYRRKFAFTGHCHQRAGTKSKQDGPEQPGRRELVTAVKKEQLS